MSQNKTRQTCANVEQFINDVARPTQRSDALLLNEIFQEVTGFDPVMWGPSIIGYGKYHYRYDSGREGDMLATGFSPRKANLSLYIMPGYQNLASIRERLGKHKCRKACLYINKLEDIELAVLRELIETGLSQLKALWPVSPR